MYVLKFLDSTGERLARVLLKGPVTIGRASDNDVQLAHQSVSRHHATFMVEETLGQQRVILRDDRSANGSFVNGHMVESGTPIDVKPGDQVRIGVYYALLLTEEGLGHSEDPEEEGALELGAPPACLESIPVERLRVLYEFSYEATVLEHTALLERAAEAIKVCLPFDILSFLIQNDTGPANITSWTAEGPCDSSSVSMNSEILEQSVLGRQIIFGDKEASGSLREFTMNLQARTEVICVPLSEGVKTFGALYLDCKSSEEISYDFDDFQLLILVARTVSRNLNSRDALTGKQDHSEEVKRESTTCNDYDMELIVRRNRSRNIGEQRAAALITARDAADAASAAKSEFLANMSHELRTPLHGILSFASFGIKKHATEEREKLLEYFQRIHHSGKTLLELLNELLDLAKLGSGTESFDFQLVDLAVLITAVTAEFSSRAAERNLALQWLKPDFTAEVWVDREKMKRLVRNLLDNAFKFSPEGGTIRVTLRRRGGSFVVSVRDEGPGIPEDEIETVFDQFVQSKNTKTGAGGTGLGLTICDMIITAHKGRIWAENCRHRGAVISFEVPRRVKASAPNR